MQHSDCLKFFIGLQSTAFGSYLFYNVTGFSQFDIDLRCPLHKIRIFLKNNVYIVLNIKSLLVKNNICLC